MKTSGIFNNVTSYHRLWMLIIAVVVSHTGFGQFVGNPGTPDSWIGGNGKIYSLTGKVGIGTQTPLRKLHISQPDHNYFRVTSTGGTQFSNAVAALELERKLNNGSTLNWDIVNQGGFKIRRNTISLFHLEEDEAQFGTQTNKTTLNIWGKHLFPNSGQLYDGAIALRSSNSGIVNTMRMDGSMIEAENDIHINWFSNHNVKMAKDGTLSVGNVYGDAGAKMAIKSESWQLNLLNDTKFWKIGVSNEDWLVGEGKLVFSNTESSTEALMVMTEQGRIGIGMTTPNRLLDINGTTRTKILEITGGADLAEPFDIAESDLLAPGTVVSIDPEKAGQLRIASQAYDRKVAGIVSGAGNIQPGMVMGQDGTIANGKHPVALTGRVYCKVDADYGSISPGDLLTTSNTPGHAMKASDGNKAQGAIIGKAMTSLEKGQGLVLVLVSLQ